MHPHSPTVHAVVSLGRTGHFLLPSAAQSASDAVPPERRGPPQRLCLCSVRCSKAAGATREKGMIMCHGRPAALPPPSLPGTWTVASDPWRMSSVDPRWPPPRESHGFIAAPPAQLPPQQPLAQRPHRVAYVLAVIMPVILLAVMAAPLGFAWTINRLQKPPGRVKTPPPLAPNAPHGQPGLGDPYFPQAGNSGYDVIKYQI